jgi:zinc D-Ala-D-Ala carboxypeptidase
MVITWLINLRVVIMNKIPVDLKIFRCRCGCGYLSISPLLVTMLEDAFSILEYTPTITSGCRCETYNEKVGGVAGSSHTTGRAVDIGIHSDAERFTVMKALCDVGFNRLGLGKSFIHADIDPNKNSNRIWVYS